MEIRKAILVLADISGYTKFLALHTMSLLHAEKIVTELLETIIDAAGAPLVVNKLEGDAVLFYAEVGDHKERTARAVLTQVFAFFDAFRERSKELTGCENLCPCDACRQGDQLRLKAVLHYGKVALKHVHNFDEVAGESVILAHRLMKNGIEADEYILMTRSFSELGAELEHLELEARTEACEGIGDIPVGVHYPPEPPPKEDAPRNLIRMLGNAVQLDGYAFARTLGLKKAPQGSSYENGTRPGFWRFSVDCVKGLWMIVRGNPMVTKSTERHKDK